MNLIKQIVKKYNGRYTEETKKSSNPGSGRYAFHPRIGKVIVDGSKISIGIAEAEGAGAAEPYQFVLFLDEDFGQELDIYPRSRNIVRIRRIFASADRDKSEKSILKYHIKGDNDLVEKLRGDEVFLERLYDEEAYIMLQKKHPKKLILRPAHGVHDLAHMEKLISILKRIERTFE